MITVSIDKKKFATQLSKLSSNYGKSNVQATKRWAVQVCKELANASQIKGYKPRAAKLALMKDARKCITTYEGTARRTNSGNWIVKIRNEFYTYPPRRILFNTADVNNWIDQHRGGSRKDVRAVSRELKMVCSEKLFMKAINERYERSAMKVKDGWLDAGEDASRGQKGPSNETLGRGLMKDARKGKKHGRVIEKITNGKNSIDVVNNLNYSDSNYVLSESDKRSAINRTSQNTLKIHQTMIQKDSNRI